MATEDFDRIDEGILARLQGDARNVTTAAIGEQFGIAGSTVATRISRMENAGVIAEYNPTVEYEAFGYDHHIQLTGTVPPEDEDAVIDEIILRATLRSAQM